VVVRILAALLVPWTACLALANPRWFPATWVQRAWVAFDVVLAIGLFALVARWRRPLALVLATLVSADATLTLFESLAWNVRTGAVRGVADLSILLVACAAPALAAAVLWGSVAVRPRPFAPGSPTSLAPPPRR
jgi:phosphatidylglycerol lysyltransferase